MKEMEKINKTVAIPIPEGCRQVYVFENEEDFIEQIATGRMNALYGMKESEKSFLPVFIAQLVTKDH